MDFKNILEKYKLGKATEEERKFIEDEIEKNRLINEYLMDEIDFDNLEISNGINIEKEKSENLVEQTSKENKTEKMKSKIDESKSIYIKVNKGIRKIILKSVSLTLIIILALKFMIAPIINKFYYNPNGSGINEADQSELYIDMKVFSELNFPNYELYYARADNEGIGEYDINLYYHNVFDDFTESINLDLKRDKNIFIKANNELSSFSSFRFFNDVDLEGLPSSTSLSAAIILKEEMSIEEVYKIIDKYEIEVNYLHVKNNDNNIHKYIGFNPNPYFYGYYLGENKDEFLVDLEEYPHFYLSEEIENNDYKAKEEHFKSILRYLTTREEFIDTFFDYNYYTLKDYKNYLNYIEENGVNITGFTAFENIDEMKKLLEDENIDIVNIYEARFSKYQK